jgi:phosphoribosylformylglycinamidine cyclo-ligase
LSKNSVNTNSITYKDSGVDIKAGDELVEKIKPYAKATKRKGMLGNLGGFGSLFEIPEKFKKPILVSGTDGVGTKLKLAFELNHHETIGQDLVAMCVNDILVQGAEPLFFLDYFACSKLDIDIASNVIKGIADGCVLANCSLVGGETAEMPGMYLNDEYDIAGFCVGAVEKEKVIDGTKVSNGDTILGLASSGAHSNGYSLIRKIINDTNTSLSDELDGKNFGDVLMTPTRIYVKSILKLLGSIEVKAMAHITGGGITGNIPRVLPTELIAEIIKNSWTIPNLFVWLKEKANLSEQELYKTFNCGVGMVLIIDSNYKDQAIKILEDCKEIVFEMGQIKNRKKDEHQVQII